MSSRRDTNRTNHRATLLLEEYATNGARSVQKVLNVSVNKEPTQQIWTFAAPKSRKRSLGTIVRQSDWSVQDTT